VVVSTEAVIGIALVELGLVVIPGPNMIYLVSRSVAQGRRAGLTSLAGVGVGFLVYLLAATAGLATLFALPQFVDPSRGHVGTQSLLLGLTQLAVGVLVNAVFVITAGSVALFFSRKPLWMRVHRYLTGTALAVFAIRLATDQARSATP
jgi:threonine/homoserine/homoserine lactone efflux protein